MTRKELVNNSNKQENIMKILNAIGIVALFIVALILGSTESSGQEPESTSQVEQSSGEGVCPANTPPVHIILVSVEDDKPVLTSPGKDEEVDVCKGNRVIWVLTGPDRDFFVDFNPTSSAPFPGPKKKNSNNNVINVRIGNSVEGNGKDYKYDFGFANGEPMDPHIIVRD